MKANDKLMKRVACYMFTVAGLLIGLSGCSTGVPEARTKLRSTIVEESAKKTPSEFVKNPRLEPVYNVIRLMEKDPEAAHRAMEALKSDDPVIYAASPTIRLEIARKLKRFDLTYEIYREKPKMRFSSAIDFVTDYEGVGKLGHDLSSVVDLGTVAISVRRIKTRGIPRLEYSESRNGMLAAIYAEAAAAELLRNKPISVANRLWDKAQELDPTSLTITATRARYTAGFYGVGHPMYLENRAQRQEVLVQLAKIPGDAPEGVIQTAMLAYEFINGEPAKSWPPAKLE
jgi:hypothetical protein